MTNIQGDNYRVWYEDNTKTIHFEGTLRLATIAEYSPITELLTKVANSSSIIAVPIQMKYTITGRDARSKRVLLT